MKRTSLVIIIALAAGLILGWLFFHTSGETGKKTVLQEGSVKNITWTCSMHPQVRMSEPGKCPICGMDLIPLTQNGTSSANPIDLHMTEEAAQLANVLTSVVTKQKPVNEIRLFGKVQADERLLQNLVAHVSGRIEKLALNFTGEKVIKGQVLATIYSPELINAQQELLEAAKDRVSRPDIYEAAIGRLRQWGLTENQVNEIVKSGIARETVDVVSNSSGIVISKNINTGDYVSQGTVLFEIADLSRVWVLFDAYENDLQFIQKGEEIFFTFQAIPGKNYSGKVDFVDPVIDPVTRVAKVRVEAGNQSGILKPEMFATGIVSSVLAGTGDKIVIPKSAVLWTGKRSVVYIKMPVPGEIVFRMREIDLGPSLGDSFVVLNGLSEGEEIVTSGTFSIDAASQLEGKPSMMNH